MSIPIVIFFSSYDRFVSKERTRRSYIDMQLAISKSSCNSRYCHRYHWSYYYTINSTFCHPTNRALRLLVMQLLPASPLQPPLQHPKHANKTRSLYFLFVIIFDQHIYVRTFKISQALMPAYVINTERCIDSYVRSCEED